MISFLNKISSTVVFTKSAHQNDIKNDHVTLKTGVINAENSAFQSYE